MENAIIPNSRPQLMATGIRWRRRMFGRMVVLVFYAFSILVVLWGVNAKGQTRAIRQNVLRRIAEKDYRPTFSVIAARLRTGINRKLALRQLDTMLLSEYGDMFWMSNCAGFYEVTKDVLPTRYKKRIRECWKKFTPYRGDTENHFLMYYGALYLMSQEWHGLSASEWFMHRSSKELHQESEQYLNYWINRTVRFGQIEFDSPRYLYYFITPLVQIAEYGKDATMKRRCRMMLEFLLADYASQYLHGNFAGAHSRIGNESVSDTRTSEATSYGEYFFEDSVKHILPDIAFAALSSYKIPPIIRSIATDRQEPYGVHEIDRSRDIVRFAQQSNTSVYKYTFMTKDYALGSIQGGLVQPIQQRSWSLTINSSHKDNIIFGLHPYASEKELGMFFPEEPSFMLEKIDAVKNGYSSENKWVGGSPFETICQWKNQIECDYDIPPTEKYQHVDLFLPGWGEFSTKDARRIRIRYDSCIVDLALKTNYELIPENGNFRLRLSLDSGKTGYFIGCNRIDEFNELDLSGTFCAKEDLPFGIHKEDWLVYSKFLKSKLGSGVLKMKYGAHNRILDFRTTTIH